MKSQIEGLASLIGYPYKNIDLKIHYLFKILPIQLIPATTLIIKNSNDYKINQPTVLISCGKKSVKASIALKKKYKNIFNIHIQDPRTSYKFFDLIIAPQHDNLNLENSLTTTFAIHNIKFNKSHTEKNKKTVNFIIGGRNKNFKFNKITQENILNDIRALSLRYFVQIIPSRRTPSILIEKIKKSKINNTNLYIDLNDPVKYGEFLSKSIANIVTWESISMISESVYSGIGTFIYSFEKENLPKRYESFHEKLIEKNYIKNFSIDFTPYKISANEDLSELKKKILNKINQSPIFSTWICH